MKTVTEKSETLFVVKSSKNQGEAVGYFSLEAHAKKIAEKEGTSYQAVDFDFLHEKYATNTYSELSSVENGRIAFKDYYEYHVADWKSLEPLKEGQDISGMNVFHKCLAMDNQMFYQTLPKGSVYCGLLGHWSMDKGHQTMLVSMKVEIDIKDYLTLPKGHEIRLDLVEELSCNNLLGYHFGPFLAYDKENEDYFVLQGFMIAQPIEMDLSQDGSEIPWERGHVIHKTKKVIYTLVPSKTELFNHYQYDEQKGLLVVSK